MKNFYTLLLLFIICLTNAQNGITYQAVILNPNSEELPGADNSRLPMINQSICLDFKIINAASQVDYQETLTTKTDEFGMVNVIIGTGTRKAGIATLFKNINWDGTAKNLVVSFDPTGNCTQFIEISNQPFTYVPYALYAVNGGATGPQGPAGPAGTNGLDGKTVLNGTTNPSASLGTNGDFYINTTTNSLFGPKANNLWGNGVSLVGPQGIQGLQGPQGVAGTNGLNGTNGVDGLSAYQTWLNAGNTGTQAQFLTALRGATGAQGPQGVSGPAGGPQGPAGANGVNGSNGLSAYQIWLNAGNTGTEALFLTALRGATGAQGPQGIQGPTGPQGTAGTNGSNGSNGTNGTNGLSAYQIWLNAGNIGTEAQFLTALRGATGAQGIQGIQGAQGPTGPTGATGPQGIAGTNGVNGTNGNDGLSAYQIWINAGNTGTEAQFLTALRGANGAQGIQGIQGVQGPTGPTGATGTQGIAGTNGVNGTNGTNGANGIDGLSAYQIWINAGNTGTEAQFLTALRGATGAQGIQGIQGVAGPSGSTGSNGTNGLDGKTILNGNQDPVNSTGNNGDFYINTTANTLFGPKTSGAWGNGVSLVGPQGETGINGKNSLINTTTVSVGSNDCPNGGIRIEVGLDINNNGILENNEVENIKTKFVCIQNNNSNLTIQQRLDLGESPFSIVNTGVPLNNLYGKSYQGGLIFHIDMVNTRGLVVTNYNVTGQKCFGCINIDISTSSDLYSGSQNTLNFINNGCDGYNGSIRACFDLVYNGYDDWFLPSSGECSAIIGNIPNWTLTEFWSSTQGPNSGYQLFATGNAGRNNGTPYNWCYGVTRAVRKFTN
jgi:hypothetical protein